MAIFTADTEECSAGVSRGGGQTPNLGMGYSCHILSQIATTRLAIPSKSCRHRTRRRHTAPLNIGVRQKMMILLSGWHCSKTADFWGPVIKTVLLLFVYRMDYGPWVVNCCQRPPRGSLLGQGNVVATYFSSCGRVFPVHHSPGCCKPRLSLLTTPDHEHDQNTWPTCSMMGRRITCPAAW